MKKIMLALLTFCITFTYSYAEVEGERFQQSAEAVQQAINGHIDAKGLQALMDSRVPFVLLDARGHKWHDNNIIPGAEMASYETSAEELAEIIPETDSLIVVYCYSFTCPLGRKLVKHLVEVGYTNVIEYPGGLTEWRDIASYPVDTIRTAY